MNPLHFLKLKIYFNLKLSTDSYEILIYYLNNGLFHFISFLFSIQHDHFIILISQMVAEYMN